MCKSSLLKKDDRPMKSCVEVGTGLPKTPRGVLWARNGSILVFSNSCLRFLTLLGHFLSFCERLPHFKTCTECEFECGDCWV